MGLNQDYLGANSVHMQNEQEIGLRQHASRKYHADIKVQVCVIRKPNIVERYLIILSPFSKCHSLMSVLNCKFRQHCRFVWIQIQVTFQYSLHRSSGYP
jgi:hypothetical protein